MRDHEDDLLAFQHEAEDQYDDYFEEDYDDEFGGFEGNEDAFAYEEDFGDPMMYSGYGGDFGDFSEAYDSYFEDEMFDSYRKTSIGGIDSNDRTLTIVVSNTSGAAAQAIVFGGNESAAQPAGVTVTVQESSHQEVREESKAHPFKIVGMKYSVSDPLQFDNILNIVHRTATGKVDNTVYQPRNATSPQNFTQNLIDDAAFEMSVTGQHSLRFTINDGVTAVFTMTVRARANMGNLLKGNNVAELSKTPRTTGLPQLDLKFGRTNAAFGLPPVRAPYGRPMPRRRFFRPGGRRFVRRSPRPRYFIPRGYYRPR